MQPKGLNYLRPIWEMIYSEQFKTGNDVIKGLNLSENDVSVTYTRYINNHKKTKKVAKPNDKTIDDAIKDGLTPGKNFLIFKKAKNI